MTINALQIKSQTDLFLISLELIKTKVIINTSWLTYPTLWHQSFSISQASTPSEYHSCGTCTIKLKNYLVILQCNYTRG